MSHGEPCIILYVRTERKLYTVHTIFITELLYFIALNFPSVWNKVRVATQSTCYIISSAQFIAKNRLTVNAPVSINDICISAACWPISTSCSIFIRNRWTAAGADIKECSSMWMDCNFTRTNSSLTDEPCLVLPLKTKKWNGSSFPNILYLSTHFFNNIYTPE